MTLGQSQVNLLTINKFAKLCRTTPRTLRFYEKKGLIKPAKIDSYNGYRYYNPRQVREFRKIKLLQNFNLSLKDINTNLGTKSSSQILNQKLKELEDNIKQQKEYKFLSEMTKVLSEEDYLGKNLKTGYTGPFILFCVRVKHGEYDKINEYINSAYKVAQEHGVKLALKEITFYVDYIYKPKDTTLEIALICKGMNIPKIKLPENYCFKKYPKTKMSFYDYHGPYEYLPVFYQRFYGYIEAKTNINPNTVFEM